ncbi:hypothetical protein FHY55_03935 [Oceanicola sp. D3]|uniref:hypothetical protein n=1 Tax=Oceanicola sp. D3 TaxID=2587163 RepID=UPI0011219B8B|nr:hypothetical protein [Oceanicola sp. D3]QDC08445.1 hypothetical protein FHY55_03935 [Oceanicola sp. D3]
MKKFATISALAVAAALALSGSASAFGKGKSNPRPPAGYQGQWYTTPAGCSYSKAQAPGEPVKWYLILNPHHIGKPNAKKSCPSRL